MRATDPEAVVHVVGAGLAGLAAALSLSAAGVRVALHEASVQAGGRCRSFHDATLDRRIDNGNHLILSGNHAALGFAREVGAEDALTVAPGAAFPFVDLRDGRRWRVDMGAGVLPGWLADPARRPPGLRPADAGDLARLLAAGPKATVAETVRRRGGAWRTFWEPMTLAVVNAPPERASARLLGAAFAGAFLRGGRASRPVFALHGLGAAFAEPGVETLRARGVSLRFGRPLRAVEAEDGRAAVLRFGDGEERLGPADSAILALPPERLKAVAPALDPPPSRGAILNAHFVLSADDLVSAALTEHALLGVLGAEAHWLFRRGDVVSVTISAAEETPLLADPPDRVAAVLWDETRRALDLPESARPEAARVLKEKRATFDQSPHGAARRLGARTRLQNLLLAGDHVDTGLPATIEGAIRSGREAARIALGSAKNLRAAQAAVTPELPRSQRLLHRFV